MPVNGVTCFGSTGPGIRIPFLLKPLRYELPTLVLGGSWHIVGSAKSSQRPQDAYDSLDTTLGVCVRCIALHRDSCSQFVASVYRILCIKVQPSAASLP